MQTANTLRTFHAPQVSQRHVVGISLAVLVNAGLVYALVQGLVPPNFIAKIVKDIVIVDVKPVTPPPPPPHPPVAGPVVDDFVPPVAPPIDYDTPPPTGGTIIVGINPPTSGPSVAARSVAGMHTIPDYPQLSRRLNEEGVVFLRLAISETGAVSDATVMKSSGHTRLDEAAVSWVKAHWRYHPAMQNGQPVASTTESQVKFELKVR